MVLEESVVQTDVPDIDDSAQANLIYRLAHSMSEGELHDLLEKLRTTQGQLTDKNGNPLFEIKTQTEGKSGKLSGEQGGKYLSTTIGHLARLFGKRYSEDSQLDHAHRIAIAEQNAGTDIVNSILFDQQSKTEYMTHMGDNSTLLDLWSEHPEQISSYVSRVVTKTYSNNDRRTEGSKYYRQKQGVLDKLTTSIDDIWFKGDFRRRGKRWVIPDRTIKEELELYLQRYNERAAADVYSQIDAEGLAEVISRDLAERISPLRRRIIHGDNKLENILAVIDDKSGYVKDIKQIDVNEVRWGYDFEDLWTMLELHGLPEDIRKSAINHAIYDHEIPQSKNRMGETKPVEAFRTAFDAIGFKEKLKYALKYSEYARNPDRHPGSIQVINSDVDKKKSAAEIFSDLRDLYFNSALQDARRLGMSSTVANLEKQFTNHPDIRLFESDTIDEKVKMLQEEYTLSTRPVSSAQSKHQMLADVKRMLQKHYDIKQLTVTEDLPSQPGRTSSRFSRRLAVAALVALGAIVGLQWYYNNRTVDDMTNQHAQEIQIMKANENWFGSHQNICREYNVDLVRRTPLFNKILASTGDERLAMGLAYLESTYGYNTEAFLRNYADLSTDSIVTKLPGVLQAQIYTRDGNTFGGPAFFKTDVYRPYGMHVIDEPTRISPEDSVEFFSGRNELGWYKWSEFFDKDRAASIAALPEITDIVRNSLREWQEYEMELGLGRQSPQARLQARFRSSQFDEAFGIDSSWNEYESRLGILKQAWAEDEDAGAALKPYMIATLYDNSPTESGFKFRESDKTLHPMMYTNMDIQDSWRSVVRIEGQNYLPSNFISSILVANALLSESEQAMTSGRGFTAARHSLINSENTDSGPNSFGIYESKPVTDMQSIENYAAMQKAINNAMVAYNLTHDITDAFAVYINGVEGMLERDEYGQLNVSPQQYKDRLNPAQQEFVRLASMAYCDLNRFHPSEGF